MKIDKALQSAVKNYQAGNLQQAEIISKKILKVQPNNIAAINMLGIVYYQLKDYDSAIKYTKKLISLNPSNARAYYILGHSMQEKDQVDEAVPYYQKALQLNPDFADVYYNLGVIFQDRKRYDEAISYYQKALRLNPADIDAQYNFCRVLQEKGQLDEAITCYRRALQLNPDLADAYNNIGIILQEKGQFDEAITSYRRALQLNPDLADAYNNIGIVLQEKGQFDEAMTYCQKALNLSPGFYKAYHNLGIILKEKGQFDDAATYFQKAMEINPDDHKVYMGLGSVLDAKGELDKAITYFQKALELNPNDYKVYMDLASVFCEKGQLDDSINYCKKALQLDSNNENVHYGMSLPLLLAGNFKQGWEEYAWRWKTKDFCKHSCFHQPSNFSQPVLEEIDTGGHTVLIYAEQGIGDTIQFIRYASLIARSGSKVIVECHKELVSLLQNIEDVDQVVGQGEPLPDFDIQCPMLNLPLVFDTTLENIPSRIPYIPVDSMLVKKWEDKIRHDDSRLKVGLVWSGNIKYKNDRNRSCSLYSFSPLAELHNIAFYSLQKGESAEQAKNPPEGMKLIDHTEEIHDFSDTAALIENLDLVISVDTAVAHLAGALGREIWTLLPFAPDWRWMLLREDSPWYPTMKLFRQPSFGDWKSVIDKIREELLKRTGSVQGALH